MPINCNRHVIKYFMHSTANTLHILKVGDFISTKSKHPNTDLILAITNKGISVRAVRTAQ